MNGAKKEKKCRKRTGKKSGLESGVVRQASKFESCEF